MWDAIMWVLMHLLYLAGMVIAIFMVLGCFGAMGFAIDHEADELFKELANRRKDEAESEAHVQDR